MVKLFKKTRFYKMNNDGSLGDGLTYTDVPAGTLVSEATDPVHAAYKTEACMLLVKTTTVIGDLYARLWSDQYEPV
jgi:hypothetical protein